jgi:glycosyltransferase involved in cell wall biosynthesis
MSPPPAPRVLVVAYDFPPQAAIGTMRTLRVVKRLHATGWDVTVLTSDPAAFLPSTPNDPLLLEQIPADVRVLRAGALRWWDTATHMLKRAAGAKGRPADTASRGLAAPRPSAATARAGAMGALARAKDAVDAGLSIPDREIGWLLPSLSTGVLQALRRTPPDVLYSSAPPWTGQLVALGLKTVLRCPWLADFRDPWSRAPWRGDRYRFAMRAAAVLERAVVRRADRIVFVASGNMRDFAAHYGPGMAHKFEHVPNGCDPGEFDAIERPAHQAGAPHVMLHAGSLYAGRTPTPVLKAVATAIDSGRLDRAAFRLRFMGANAVASDLPEACRQLGIADVVEFLPRVPRRDSLRAMVSASSLLLLQPGHTVSVPGKVYEYLAAARPILALAEGETANVVGESGLGVSVRPGDDTGMLEALLTVVDMAQRALPPPPRALYDGNVGAATIEHLLRGVLMDPPAETAPSHSPQS